MDIKFKVRWSPTVKSITAFITILVIICEAVLIIEGAVKNWILALTALLIAVCAIYFMMMAPTSIVLTNRQVILQKLIGKIAINYDDIRSIQSCPFSHSENRRLLGSGGYCGYTGVFYHKNVGQYHSFIGDKNQAFLIETKSGKKYLFSCNDYQKVIELVSERIMQNQ